MPATNALHRVTAYIYNNANQRTMADSQDGTYWTYSYDGFGHVTSAYLVNGDLMAGRQTDYTYSRADWREARETPRSGARRAYRK